MTDNDLSLEKLLFSLNTLAELNEEISSPKDFDYVIKSSLYMVMGSFTASKGIILGLNAAKNAFTPIVSKGLKGTEGLSLTFSQGALKTFAGIAHPIDLKSPDPLIALLGPAKEQLDRMNARIVVWLTIRNETVGLIAISEKFSGEGYTPYDLNFLSIMAQNISFSLHSQNLLLRLVHKYSENRSLCDDLSRIYNDTILAFAAAIDAKDAYTKGHSNRVSAYCAAVATEMGLSKDEVEGIRIAGLMHDIGKIAVDKIIINKESKLDVVELNELASHPVIGYDILSKIKFPWANVAAMTRGHHEKYEGSGYPDGLKGDRIPLGSRIMTLVDSFDAMTTDRPYRKKLPFSAGMAEIRKHNKRHFDPEVVNSFTSVLKKEASGACENPVILPNLFSEPDYDAINAILNQTGS